MGADDLEMRKSCYRCEEGAWEHVKSVGIPARMRGPSAARETLRLSPLMQAGWADASSIKSVPFVATSANPFVFLAGRPAAQRAPDAWAGWVPVSLYVLVRSYCGGVRYRSHRCC